MSVQDVLTAVQALIDELSRSMARAEYRELLDEIAAEVEARTMALDDDEAAEGT